MTMEEWIEFYNSKTNEPFRRDNRFDLFFVPEKGFCEIGLNQPHTMYIINQLCGDAKFWKEKVDGLARDTGIMMCGTWCIRPEIYAYIRLFGYKVIQDDVLVDGKHKIVATHKKTGKKGWASPAYTYKFNGQTAYLITWEP